jgi:PAS domain-containing protein
MGANAKLDLVRHDGSELAIDVALLPIQLDEKPWTVACIRDASERRATEHARSIATQLADVAKVEAAEALAASERRFRNAFEQNMAPMIFTDLEDRVIVANEAFCQLLGRTKEENSTATPPRQPTTVTTGEGSTISF